MNNSRGNDISANNFEFFYGNIFYMNSILDIFDLCHDDDIIKLFDNNTFNVKGNIISKDDYLQIKTFYRITYLINNAEEGDTIKLSGYYFGIGKEININKRVNIIGENNTILDAKKLSRILEISAPNVTIENMKLINAIYPSGSSIYWIGDNGSLSNCQLENNDYDRGLIDFDLGSGGAILWQGSNGTLMNCTFKNNHIYSYGGALYLNGSDIKIINSLFQGNSVINNFYSSEGGGAIYNKGEKNSIENCTFIENSALDSCGGAINIFNGSVNVKQSIFINNSARMGNHIFAHNFEFFSDNLFYLNSISEINDSAQDDDILKLFENNNFIVDGKIIPKDENFSKLII